MNGTGSRHLVDPQLLPFLDGWPTVALNNDLLVQLRAPGRLPIAQTTDPGALAVRRSHHSIPGPPGAPDVGLAVYHPPGLEGPAGCIVHMHGGGYVMGAAAPLEPSHRLLASSLGCVIVSVDYRLAPETRHPGPVEDCYAALAWTFAQAGRLGIDPDRIGLSGESAGGGLAAALALMARDRGEHRVAFQHLIYPMIDDRTCAALDPNPHVGEYIWTPHNNHFGWSALLGVEPGSPAVSPYAAAARAEDLSGLPPTFISTGALDLFLEEDLDYARRLLRAGVSTELHIYPGGFHGFDLAPEAGVATSARRDSLSALERFLRKAPI